MGEQAVLQDALCTQFVTAMYQCHLAGKIGQKQSFFNCRVAAADHHHFFPAIKETVASGTSRHAKATQALLFGQAQPFGLRARRNDQGIAGVDLATIANRFEWAARQIDFHNPVRNDLRADMFRLGAHLLHQPRPLDNIGKAWIILHFRGDCQLSAGLGSFNQYGLAHGTGGIDSGCIAGRPRTNDKNGGVANL